MIEDNSKINKEYFNVILWSELGTKADYEGSTNIENLAAFIRGLVGLSQEAINEKFGEYL